MRVYLMHYLVALFLRHCGVASSLAAAAAATHIIEAL
jgi:hypothetical protein